MSLPQLVQLKSGAMIPSIGLGTWQAPKGQVGEAVKAALHAGYRHIDGAWIYRNEEEVGRAIKESGIPREEIFLTSKLWNSFHHPENVANSLEATLKALQTDYLDLYLIHFPVAFGLPSDAKPRALPKGPDGKILVDNDLTRDPLPTWRAMESLVASGKVRHIGISNFSKGRTAYILKHARVKPSVNQIEVNWLWPQHDLVSWCQSQGVVVEAYSPLGSTEKVQELLADTTVNTIAKKLNATPAQVHLSWLVQRGMVVLVKSVTASRIRSNLQVIKLPDEDFAMLNQQSASHKQTRLLNPGFPWGVANLFEDSDDVLAKL